MRFRLVALILLPIVTLGYGSNCEEALTTEPPFYVSSVGESSSETYQLDEKGKVRKLVGGQNTLKDQLAIDKFYSNIEKSGFKFLERGSLVRVLGNRTLGPLPNTGPGPLIQVEVLKAAKIVTPFLAPLAPKAGAKRSPPAMAIAGDRGFIVQSALNQKYEKLADKHVFILNQPTALVKLNGIDTFNLEGGTELRLAMQGGQYRILKCGDKISYIFHTKSPGLAVPGDLAADLGHLCGRTTVLSDSQILRVRNLQQFVADLYPRSDFKAEVFTINDWGRVKLPLDPPEGPRYVGTDISGVARDGSYVHYQGSDRKESDIWGTPFTVCGLMGLMQKWRRVCASKGCKENVPQLGDIGFVTPGKVSGKNLDPLDHEFHNSGACVDMRPFRKDRSLTTLYIDTQPDEYDAKLMKEFVLFLAREGASPIYFNDLEIYKALNKNHKKGEDPENCMLDNPTADIGSKVKFCNGHFNHIHFCLLPGHFKGETCHPASSPPTVRP